MAKREIIEIESDLCEKKTFKMCSDRSISNRNCAMPRCCGICYKILECKGYCKYLSKIFPKE